MTLSESDVRLARLAVSVVLADWQELRRVRESAGPNEPDRRWRETMLQAHLFCGIPRTLAAFARLADCGGLGEPDPDEVQFEADMPERGQVLFDQIYGNGSERVKDELRGHHEDLAHWILGHAYGRVLTRPGLSADRRELLAVASLAALGQERQLASHARGAVRCGATVEEVLEVLENVGDLIGEERTQRARRVVERFS